MRRIKQTIIWIEVIADTAWTFLSIGLRLLLLSIFIYFVCWFIFSPK